MEDVVGRYRVNIDSGKFVFKPALIDQDNPDFLTSVQYDQVSGWLKVTLNLAKYGCDPTGKDESLNCEFNKDQKNFCKPVSYCSWNMDTKSCGCTTGSGCKDDSVCSWGRAISTVDARDALDSASRYNLNSMRKPSPARRCPGHSHRILTGTLLISWWAQTYLVLSATTVRGQSRGALEI